MAEASEFLERKGKVVSVQPIKTIGKDPKYQKQVGGFTIETSRTYKEKEYHDFISFDCQGNVISQIQDLQVGDGVRVEFTIGGVKWKDTYFNKLKAYKVETTEFAPRKSQESRPQVSVGQKGQPEDEFLDALNTPVDDIDIPF